MKTLYKSSLPKGFAHPINLSKLEVAFGCPALDELEVMFADDAYCSRTANYFDYLSRTNEPYPLIRASYHHPQTGISASNDDTKWARGDYYNLYVYPVRIAELKAIKTQLPSHLKDLGTWLTTLRSDIWKIHTRKLQISWNPQSALLEVTETEQLPSRIR